MSQENEQQILEVLREIRDGQREVLGLLAAQRAAAEEQVRKSRESFAESVSLQRLGLARQRTVRSSPFPAFLPASPPLRTWSGDTSVSGSASAPGPPPVSNVTQSLVLFVMGTPDWLWVFNRADPFDRAFVSWFSFPLSTSTPYSAAGDCFSAKPLGNLTTCGGSAALSCGDRVRLSTWQTSVYSDFSVCRSCRTRRPDFPPADQDFNPTCSGGARAGRTRSLHGWSRDAARSHSAAEPLAALDEFIQSSPCIRPFWPRLAPKASVRGTLAGRGPATAGFYDSRRVSMSRSILFACAAGWVLFAGDALAASKTPRPPIPRSRCG